MCYGLIGEKLGHSFSKEIHEQLANYTYDLIPLSKQEFPIFIKKRDFKALNVTIPYKKDVIPYLDYIDPFAKEIGAVNTIVNKNNQLIGYNTDYYGFQYMLDRHNIHVNNKKVLVLGNGGASCAIQAVLKHKNAKEVVIVNRTKYANTISYDECYKYHTDAQVIVNTTPVGMYPNIQDAPLQLSLFSQCEAVLDVIYNPIFTSLCISAKNSNITYVGGLEMLIAQAKKSIEYFTNQTISDSIIDVLYHKMLHEHFNIVLIGMPSAGKTTIGRQLAQILHKDFIDVDEEIINISKKSIPEIFNEIHEEGFRQMETDIISNISARKNTIISTGGGVIKNKENIDFLSKNGIFVFIDRPLESLISNDPNRPLSNSVNDLKRIYHERIPLYKKYADITVKNKNSIQECINQIITDFNAL